MDWQLAHRGQDFRKTWAHRRSTQAAFQTPQFNVGDLVREASPIIGAEAEVGTITDSYEFKGEYRYVVKCKSGRDAVFFEHELTLERR